MSPHQVLDAPATPIAATLAELGAQLLVRGWLSANNIVFHDSPAGACVVDTGYASHAPQTAALIDQALRGQPLARVLNTHLHSDHCGGNASLARRWPGLHLSVPVGYRARLQPWDEAGLSYRDTDQTCEPFTPQAFIAAGDSVLLGQRHWQVHATPGHDPDAVVLFEPVSRTLISGDALWESRLAIIFPELVGEPGFDAAHQALDLIEALAPRLVLPGHGQPFTGVAAALDASRQRLRGFAAAPVKHRQHAARSLVSFHMLEHRRRPRAELVAWIARTPIFLQALQCEADPALAGVLADATVDRLLADGVLLADGELIVLPTAG
jgi:glyoxylase-like metal-dependent hydrolase (beta-lactamase superfamily II)